MNGPTVGIIGLGAMGGAIAERLVRSGFALTVYDINDAAVDRLVGLGAKRGTATSVASRDVLMTSLPSDAHVKEVLIDNGSLAALGQGTLIELSTILPETMQQVAELATKTGARVVDSPVTGGPYEAMDGQLGLLVGAEDEDVERVRPILEAIGRIERVGGVGRGKAIKLVNNTMSMGNMVVAAEAFTLGLKLGLEPEQMFDTLSRSGGRSLAFTKRVPYALAADFSPRFALYLSEKDLRLALSMAHGIGFPMPVAAVIHQMYEAGMAKGLGQEDMVSVLKVFGDWEVQPEAPADNPAKPNGD